MIRSAASDDLGHCADILADSMLWERYDRGRADALAFFTAEYEQGSEIWVYEEEEAVMAYLVLIPRGMMGEFPFVRALGVRRDHRGCGIGTKMLAFAEERMFKLKPKIFMMVSDFNDGAQNLYKRLGYERVGEITHYKKRGIAEYILLKRNDA